MPYDLTFICDHPHCPAGARVERPEPSVVGLQTLMPEGWQMIKYYADNPASVYKVYCPKHKDLH